MARQADWDMGAFTQRDPLPGNFTATDDTSGKPRTYNLDTSGQVRIVLPPRPRDKHPRLGSLVLANLRGGRLEITTNGLAHPALAAISEHPEAHRDLDAGYAGECYRPRCGRWVTDLRGHLCAGDSKGAA